MWFTLLQDHLQTYKGEGLRNIPGTCNTRAETSTNFTHNATSSKVATDERTILDGVLNLN